MNQIEQVKIANFVLFSGNKQRIEDLRTQPEDLNKKKTEGEFRNEIWHRASERETKYLRVEEALVRVSGG